MRRTNIVLIGMPGAGKSTVGVLLAKETARSFVDTDLSIQEAEQRSLQDILDSEGYLQLRAIEERVLLTLQLVYHVVATGGSAAYSEKAMHHLRAGGVVVFLDVPPDILLQRIHNFGTRGIARRPDQTWDDLFAERVALYRKYADLVVPCGDGTHEEICERVRLDVEAWEAGETATGTRTD